MSENTEPNPDAGSAGLNPLRTIDSMAPPGWRLKIAKVVAQIIAGSEKGAVAYGEMRERLDTIEGRSIVNKGMAEAVLHQAKNDPEIMERAKARFLGQALQKQENLEAVLLGAAQSSLLLAPPSSEPGPTGKVNSDIDNGDAFEVFNQAEEFDADQGSGSDNPLNPDWAATFAGIAENATTEELRSRMSRVLAGEISSPGTYSRATLRQIAELEKLDLEAVKLILPFILGSMIIRFEEDSSSQPSIDMLLPLAEAGLVTDATNMLSQHWAAANSDRDYSWVVGKKLALRFTMKKDKALVVPMTKLTKTGAAVADLLGRHDERAVLRRLADSINPDLYHAVHIGELFTESRVKEPMQQLKPDAQEFTLNTSGLGF